MQLNLEFHLCTGSACRKKKKRLKKLRAVLADFVGGGMVKCQDVCKGPVVVVVRDQEKYWFKKVGNKKARRQIVNFIQGEKLGGYLTKRLVKRRALKSKKRSKKRLELAQSPLS